MDASIRTFDVLMETASDVALGRVVVTVKRLEGSPEDQAKAPGFAGRYGNPTSNCTYAGNGAFTCTNQDKEWWFGTSDSCKLFSGLGTWADQKVRLTNDGTVDVTAYVTQGFDVHDQKTLLRPGESAVFHRIDRGTLSYNLLIKVESGTAKVTAVPDRVD